MERRIEYLINEEDAGAKVCSFLHRQGYSGHLLRMLKNIPGGVKINGKNALNIQPLALGDILTITIKDEKSSDITPVAMELDIFHEDEDILVVNKPAGLGVHPSSHGYESSLANGICNYFAQQGEAFVFRAAHRLDRHTSGLLIIAKNLISSGILFSLMKEKAVKRQYLAVVKGKTPKKGRIIAPIGRGEGCGLVRKIDFNNGAYGETYFQRINYKNGYSLLKVQLATGRTHQIRVHLQYIGFPLCGDFLYGEDFSKIKRQALHSESLEFCHPITKKLMVFSCPMPEDMETIFL